MSTLPTADRGTPPLHTPAPTGGWRGLPLRWKIGTVPALFVVLLLGLQFFNSASIASLQGDTRVVDIAARQRVLNERFLAQVLSTAEGHPQDYALTRTRFNESADALTNGGDAVLNMDTGARTVLPPAPTDSIRDQLAQQKRLMTEVSDTADALLRTTPTSANRTQLLRELRRETDALSQLTNQTTKALSDYSVDRVQRTAAVQQALAFLGAFVGVVLSTLITQIITAPLAQVMARAQEIGGGDLRGRPLPVRSSDELGQLSETFNTMLFGLREVAQQSRAAAENLGAAAAEILASAQQRAAGSGEQAAAVQETTTTMEEISRSGAQIADKARQVSASAEATSTASDAGLQAVQEAGRSMRAIQERAEAVAQNVVMLSEKTQAIGDIIVTVNNIAEQSHLLALNAAIEAAGAGEHGRRFGVVADEMKHLAEQSRDATVQVRSILSDIQRDIHTSVMLTEETVKRVELGKQESDTAEAAIRRMATSIVESANAFQQIVAATNQQQIGFEQVTQAAQQIRTAVDQATTGTRQLEAAAMDINALSQQLRAAIERYQL